MRFPGRKRTEIAQLREAVLVLAAHLGQRLEADAREVAGLRGEVAAVRKQLDELPRSFDASVARSAMEVVRDAGRQTGIAQQQAALLTDNETLLELAGEVAVAGAEGLLAERADQEDDRA